MPALRNADDPQCQLIGIESIGLLALGAVPIVNENDTVATAEIRYGDNDRLAARVAQMASADCLILLSDVDALYTADPTRNPNARPIPLVEEIDASIVAMAGESASDLGSGGMITKLAAARVGVMRLDRLIDRLARRLDVLGSARRRARQGGDHRLVEAVDGRRDAVLPAQQVEALVERGRASVARHHLGVAAGAEGAARPRDEQAADVGGRTQLLDRPRQPLLELERERVARLGAADGQPEEMTVLLQVEERGTEIERLFLRGQVGCLLASARLARQAEYAFRDDVALYLRRTARDRELE